VLTIHVVLADRDAKSIESCNINCEYILSGNEMDIYRQIWMLGGRVTLPCTNKIIQAASLVNKYKSGQTPSSLEFTI